MDYKELLWKYIDHVWRMEGITFIDRFEKDLADAGITPKEIEELKYLSMHMLEK